MGDEMEPEAGSESQDPEDDISWDDVQEELDRAKEASGATDAPASAEEKTPDVPPSPDGGESAAATVNGGEENRNLEFILDIPLRLSVELGRTRMLVNDLLKLGQGSVIELTKLVGEPLDIMVNGKEIARGEVVVVNEKFGVRLTDIVNPLERVQQLH